MIGGPTLTETFEGFVADAEPRLRHALFAAFGPELGRDSLAHALAYGWEHWERICVMDNPVAISGAWGAPTGAGSEASSGECRSLLRLQAARLGWSPHCAGALRKLTERERIVVLLIHGWEWSYREVAELLDVSRSSIQTYMDRAMTKLRDSLRVTE